MITIAGAIVTIRTAITLLRDGAKVVVGWFASRSNVIVKESNHVPPTGGTVSPTKTDANLANRKLSNVDSKGTTTHPGEMAPKPGIVQPAPTGQSGELVE